MRKRQVESHLLCYDPLFDAIQEKKIPSGWEKRDHMGLNPTTLCGVISCCCHVILHLSFCAVFLTILYACLGTLRPVSALFSPLFWWGKKLLFFRILASQSDIDHAPGLVRDPSTAAMLRSLCTPWALLNAKNRFSCQLSWKPFKRSSSS